MNLNRRTFLKTTAAVGGGLMIGGYIAMDGDSAELLAAGSFEPNIWLRINSDDTVRIMLSQLEMGQGVMTSVLSTAEDVMGWIGETIGKLPEPVPPLIQYSTLPPPVGRSIIPPA